MKTKSYLLGLIVLILCSYQATFAVRGDEAAKLWIFLKGRPYLRNGMPTLQQAGFQPAAVERRQLRGGGWDSSDMPVDPRYIQAIRAAGAEILQESRWLNAISVRCGDSCRERVAALSFVLEMRGVATFRRATEKIVTSDVGLQTLRTPTAVPPLNYGSSREQLAQMKV